MNKEEARRFIGRYRPCEHENADTRLGDGKTWAKCEDCGATFEQARAKDAREAASQFDRALDELDRQHEYNTKLMAYAAELKLPNITIDELIDSHRRVVQELNASSRPVFKKAVAKACKKAEKQVLDCNWIKLSTLRRLSARKLAELLTG